jgi:transposase
MQITTIGLDIAKNVFQVHGIDAAEKVVVKETASSRSGDEVLRSFAALPHWHGSLRQCALLGT